MHTSCGSVCSSKVTSSACRAKFRLRVSGTGTSDGQGRTPGKPIRTEWRNSEKLGKNSAQTASHWNDDVTAESETLGRHRNCST